MGHAHAVNAILVVGDMIVSGSSDSTIKVRCAALSECISYSVWQLWSADHYGCLGTLTGHSGRVHDLIWESSRLFSCADDGTVKVSQ